MVYSLKSSTNQSRFGETGGLPLGARSLDGALLGSHSKDDRPSLGGRRGPLLEPDIVGVVCVVLFVLFKSEINQM